ncbi:MAG: hypothetical protein CL867_03820 [Cytophagaceae bacterium]|nr:hypothetical protein [Cytophagaceae bacterium]
MKYLPFIGATLFLLLASCSSKITHPKDYDFALSASNKKSIDQTYTTLDFWNGRLSRDSTNLVALPKVAQAYSDLFDATAQIHFLKASEMALEKSAAIAAIDPSLYLESLAANYIKQHRFKDALRTLERAYNVGGGTASTLFMLFDVHMELGNYQTAQVLLEKNKDFSDFNYITRLAKLKDYQGDLDATIHYMEEAQRMVANSHKKELQMWVDTNLADYYGHAGRLQESYAHYLKALKQDPTNAYAKKGIAWIAFSHEKNAAEALRIIQSIPDAYYSPDYYLLLAEIATFQEDEAAKVKWNNSYLNAVANSDYGRMYQIPTALLLAEEENAFKDAIAMAKEEVQQRPTPETYSVLAYILNLAGSHEDALLIAEKHIRDKTFEPEANLRLASIYKSNKKYDELKRLEADLKDSSYELGPITTQKIEELYN